MKIEHIPLDRLQMNEGQLPWLPRNPRQWTQPQIDRLKRSIQETPDLLEARGLIVFPCGKAFIVIGGNMRLVALAQLGFQEAPCFILPKTTDHEKVKQIVLKDNGGFGSWNAALLSLEWADIDLKSLGIEIPEIQHFGDKNQELNVGDFSENIVLKLKFKEPEATLVSAVLGEDKALTLLSALNYGNEDN